jgi:excisionase family DNA binding protein
MSDDRTAEDPELRAGEAARILQIHRKTLNRWGDRGWIRFTTLPSGQRRYRRADLDAARTEHDTQEPTP